MENRLLAVSAGYQDDINIGDYVQALAASHFFEKIDGFVEREELKSYNGNESKVIMNGWYMHNPNQWPPTEKISPLFVSFHINKLVEDVFFTDESVQYLKEYEPIGCRDYYTVKLLQSKNIKAYFTGCLTLTLSQKYKRTHNSGKIFFVDPFFKIRNRSLSWKAKAIFAFLIHPIITLRVRKQRKLEKRLSIGDLLDNAWFYKTYSTIFDKSIILNAEYIYHESPFYREELNSNSERLQYAEKLIESYSNAALVVTSRIHCALPCTSMEVPIVYIKDAGQGESSSSRMEGLEELFNIVESLETRLNPVFEISGKISLKNIPKQKLNYIQVKDNLLTICSKFTRGL